MMERCCVFVMCSDQRAAGGGGRPLQHPIQHAAGGIEPRHPDQRHGRQCRAASDGGECDAAQQWDGGGVWERVVRLHSLARVRGRGHVHVPGVRWGQLFQRSNDLHHSDARYEMLSRHSMAMLFPSLLFRHHLPAFQLL